VALTKVGKEGITGISNSSDATAITIDSSERVGIGTSVNSLFNAVGGVAKLAVTGESSSTNILGNTDASIAIINTDQTANNTAGLHFARADTDDTPNYAGASIVAQFPDAQVTGQYPKGELAFLTSTTANAAPSEKMRIDATGRVTMPSQPAFQVYKSSDQNNIAADNSSVVVTWQTEAFDIGSNFASNTFTAPVTGKYLLTAKLRIDNADSASQYYILKLDCSNGDAFDIFDSNVFSSDITYVTLQVTTVQDMDANDTAQVQITQQGGTAQSDIIDARHYSNFSGYLLG
jgi:hypothetical protein